MLVDAVGAGQGIVVVHRSTDQNREKEERGSTEVSRRETSMCALSSFGIKKILIQPAADFLNLVTQPSHIRVV